MVMAMYMLRFNFILGLNFIFLCFKLINVHYHTPERRELKIKPRIKLNHNIYIILRCVAVSLYMMYVLYDVHAEGNMYFRKYSRLGSMIIAWQVVRYCLSVTI